MQGSVHVAGGDSESVCVCTHTCGELRLPCGGSPRQRFCLGGGMQGPHSTSRKAFSSPHKAAPISGIFYTKVREGLACRVASSGKHFIHDFSAIADWLAGPKGQPVCRPLTQAAPWPRVLAGGVAGAGSWGHAVWRGKPRGGAETHRDTQALTYVQKRRFH